jgi:hypothetical protein
MLLKEGLLLAAYREAVALADEESLGDDGRNQALAVMQQALKGMDLEDTPPWEELVRRIDAATRER